MALRKMILKMNGVERMIVCDPDKDTLADVIRRTGLTGTKVGCGTGACGVCNVILNGELVRSCVKKMKKVEEYSEILTVEGIGQPGNLHPIQQAFIYHGSIQCGFCIPGFVVSSYALLQQNNNPTREEVRDWFTKHRNACRCTGYKQIVDAVMTAAKVMRGELTMDDITFKAPADKKVYGTNAPRPAALAKVTGLCDYGDDIGSKMPDNTLHLAVVLPGVSHGNIKNIDFQEAEKMPGVVKVVTAKDIKGSNLISSVVLHPRSKTKGMDHPILCDKKVRRYGDVVALVVADTREHARAAAKAVKVDVEKLPAYLNYVDAVAPGAIEVHEGVPNNFVNQPLIKGEDTRNIFDKCAHIVEGSFHSQSEPHLVLEPDCGQAYVDEGGRLTIHCKTHALAMQAPVIADGLGLTPDKMRIIENPTGAAFGYSLHPTTCALLGAAAMAVDAPVTMTLSYAEHNFITGKRLEGFSNAKIGCDENGKIQAFDFDFAMNMGGYTDFADAFFITSILWSGFGYNIPNIRGIARCGVSNQTLGVPYRGSRSLQTYTMSEAIIDMLAEKAGIDPFDFRYINAAVEGDTNSNSYPYKNYVFKDLLDAIKPYYDEAKERQKKFSTADKKRGVGITLSSFNVGEQNDYSEVALELCAGGKIKAYNQWEDLGQGGDIGTIAITHEALREYMDIGYDDISLVMNDTLYCPPTGGSGANRQHYMVSGATKNAVEQLIGAMKKPDGTLRTYEEMVAENIPTKYTGSFSTAPWTVLADPNTGKGSWIAEYNYMAVMAEVEVDVNTGKTTVLKIVNVYDIGTVGNPQVVEGQGYSGIMHGIGVALREQYIDDGTYDNIVKCGFTYCNDMPDDVVLISNPSPRATAAYGGVGCCEGFQSTPHVTVVNAIANACGARVYDLPATPDKVKAAIDAIAKGEEIKPYYFLGSDFDETFDEMIENPVGVDNA